MGSNRIFAGVLLVLAAAGAWAEATPAADLPSVPAAVPATSTTTTTPDTSTSAYPVTTVDWLVCTQEMLQTASDGTTLGDIRQRCLNQSIEERTNLQARNRRALDNRLLLERATENNPFVITPYQRNYVFPLSYWSNPNSPPNRLDDETFRHLESKFQLSIKVPIADFGRHFKVYGAFTGVFFWQSYNGHISRPFREINYEPEIFVTHPLHWSLGPIDSKMLMLGASHQSNGQDVPLSRSWNRLYVRYLFATGPWYWSIKPWWRLPEKKKTNPTRRSGDDNPDIEHYYGHAEFHVSRVMGNHVLEGLFRNNFHKRNNAGAAEISYTFPLNHRFKGIVQVFTGYGDSLIAYNHYENRFSFGILLTDIL